MIDKSLGSLYPENKNTRLPAARCVVLFGKKSQIDNPSLVGDDSFDVGGSSVCSNTQNNVV